jgi:RNA polymerase sigma factor (TIGR02999 family)
MATEHPVSVTELLTLVRDGDTEARDRLWQLIYAELHIIAKSQAARDASGRAPQPTSLVHEAFLRLSANEQITWADRRHFFAAAAKAMRSARVDDVRKRNRLKRGGGWQPAALADGLATRDQDLVDVLAVDEALSRLEQHDPQKAEVVSLKYFAGLTIDEIADVLGVSPRKVDKEWYFARAWLHRELS